MRKQKKSTQKKNTEYSKCLKVRAPRLFVLERFSTNCYLRKPFPKIFSKNLFLIQDVKVENNIQNVHNIIRTILLEYYHVFATKTPDNVTLIY